jgi:hypothetical protein
MDLLYLLMLGEEFTLAISLKASWIFSFLLFLPFLFKGMDLWWGREGKGGTWF